MTTAADPAIEDSGALAERVQELQARLDGAPDSQTKRIAEELIAALVAFYGDGLERLLSRLLGAGEAGARLAAGLTDDPLLSTLLLIHDLHPVALEQRVQAALESVRPYMESHGGDVVLLSLEDGVARIHLRGSCSDCSASSVTLELAITQALEERAPDLEGLVVEGVAPQLTGLALPMAAPMAGPTGIELPVIISGAEPAREVPGRSPGGRSPQAAEGSPEPQWRDLEGAAAIPDGELAAITVGSLPLVIANVDGSLLAYRDECAACGSPLRDGVLSAGALSCPACERSYFLPRAGRSMDAERIQLAPVPLLRERGSVKVAVAV